MKFPRQFRLLKPAEFKRVFQQATRSSDHCFRVLARVNGLGFYRLGMAVSKKACNRAVGRNRIKRVVRESFRTRIAGYSNLNTLDFIVLPTVQAVAQGNAELARSLAAHWRRLMTKTETNANDDGSHLGQPPSGPSQDKE